MHAFNRIKHVYRARGFKIVDLHGDNEFEKIQGAILPTKLTLAAAGELVGPVERSIITMKESSRAGLHGTPFTQVPMVMVKGLLKVATLLLNAFPNSASISKTLNPRNIVQGLPNLDFAMLKYEFVQYGELSKDNIITNTMIGRTKGAIALYPKGDHGSWAFLSLSTGIQVHGRTFTPLPITDEVIDRVAELAEAQGQPIVHDGCLLYEWRPGMPINDDDAELEGYYGHINYAQEEDHEIDPPDITEPVAYDNDQPAPYDSDTEDEPQDETESEPEDEPEDEAYSEFEGAPNEPEGFGAEGAVNEMNDDNIQPPLNDNSDTDLSYVLQSSFLQNPIYSTTYRTCHVYSSMSYINCTNNCIAIVYVTNQLSTINIACRHPFFSYFVICTITTHVSHGNSKSYRQN